MNLKLPTRALSFALVLLFSALGLVSAPARAQRVVPENRAAVQLSFAPVVKIASPAVVNIFVRGRVQQADSPFATDPMFRRFFGLPDERAQSSLGSGVIVSRDGLVVTNTHVIKIGGTAEIRVVLADKRELDAKIVLADEKTDIAILKIAGEGYPFLDMDVSDRLEVGDLVLAIGNPFGVGQTVTQGIVSALARSEIGKSDAQVFIQTDAAINPGNSGGALVDMSGRLVGINTAIFSRSGGSHGIGFAIPAKLVKLYLDSAVTGRRIERPWIGARLEPLTREIAEQVKAPRVTGAVVMRVAKTGPASEAQLEAGDVIIGVDGQDTADPRAVLYRLTTRGPGNVAKLDILRAGKGLKVDFPVRGVPQPGRDDVRNLSGNHPFDGARIANLSGGLAEELGLDEDAGVAVLSVRQGSIAANLGLQPGDIVAQVGRQDISQLSDLEPLLRQRQRVWQVAIKRGGRTVTLQIAG